eukprot:366235-Chlamydomonas_euryale.AAC.6
MTSAACQPRQSDGLNFVLMSLNPTSGQAHPQTASPAVPVPSKPTRRHAAEVGYRSTTHARFVSATMPHVCVLCFH